MSRKLENTSFTCVNCNEFVNEISKGTIRNHCPFCLISVHLDVLPGDRASDCGGAMRPVSVLSHSKKGWQVVHKCDDCGHEQPNRVSDDDCRDVVANIMKKMALLPRA